MGFRIIKLFAKGTGEGFLYLALWLKVFKGECAGKWWYLVLAAVVEEWLHSPW